MDLSDIKNSLRKFFRGEETQAGRELIDRWYHHFDQTNEKLSDALSNKEKEELRKELLSRIRTSAGYGCWSSRGTGIIKIAAGFIIVLLISLPILSYEGFLELGNQRTESIEYKIASNPAGQTSKITLADGSVVWLSAASTLRYPESFTDSLRRVSLKGEAFFDVVRNSEKPFIVSSGELETKVLGTSFNIRIFEDEENILVTVATGKVAVRKKAVSAGGSGQSVDPVAVLSPDQQLVFNKKDQSGITQTVRSALYTSWKDGKLIFENHSFGEIANRLEQWYGVRFYFADVDLKQERFKIVFENTSLEYALQMLQVIKDFEYRIKDRQVWISSAE